MARFFYKIDEKEYGPATESQLAEVGIGPGTLVRYEHGRYYKPAREINDLAYLFENMSDEELASGPVPLEPEVHTGYAEDLAREAVEQGRRVELETDRVPGQSAGWLLPAGLVFALAGGVIGGGIGAYIRWRIACVENGRVLWKYKQSHRTWGAFILGLSVVSIIFWNVYFFTDGWNWDSLGMGDSSIYGIATVDDYPYDSFYGYDETSDETLSVEEPADADDSQIAEDLDYLEQTASFANSTLPETDDGVTTTKIEFDRDARTLTIYNDVLDESDFNHYKNFPKQVKLERLNFILKNNKYYIDMYIRTGCSLAYVYSFEGQSVTVTLTTSDLESLRG